MVAWVVQQQIATAFSFIGFVLVTIPLYWHLEAWNVGCVLYIFWSGSQNLIQFINMTIWKDNVINSAPVWCDITTRWRMASGIGICTASLIINRRLYKIATVSAVSVTQRDRRRMIYIDLAIGLIPSILVVALYWFIQGHRFDLYEGYGCQLEIANTILSYFLYACWPIVIGLISMFYCTMTLFAFYKRRKQFGELMASNKNLTFNRYLRLMGLASIEMLCTVPLGIWSVTLNAREPIYTWYGLANLHYDFSRVDQYPTIIWYNVPLARQAIVFDIWNIISCALVFFVFFGCAEEARRHYSLAISSVARKVGIPTTILSRLGSDSTGSYGPGTRITTSGLAKITIPSFAGGGKSNNLGSFNSFSDRISMAISIGDETPVDDDKIEYTRSEHSAGSSTFLGSPVTPKDAPPSPVSPIIPPVSPISPPPRAHDASALLRPSPDVPSSYRRDSIDIV
ncbi:putative fungal pheromoneG-protein-coupled receptor [Wolfiporia cocos MD-104 SS10]|uniref:Putative fungal pheromoneG-protein-coupled receptor n=14 Tax=Wolfiporia cocos TaxID=81056 RepID=A0A2H3JL45_WOLCO|nr:putative fungal pheromoneG-protein-coupled receptor [Wolfiporia cocos MD-104 SS10]